MLADDDLLLDDLGEEAEGALQLVERRALTDLDPNDASGPADAATNPAQVFLLASCSRFECESVQIVPSVRCWTAGRCRRSGGCNKLL